MVARRNFQDFAIPERDGLPLRRISEHSTQKAHYLWKYADTAAIMTASPRAFPGCRTYADLYASNGICETKTTGALSFGSALLAVQATIPFDLYYLNDIDEDATAALAARIRRLGISGASVIDFDARADDAVSRARSIGDLLTPFGPKIVVATGDANESARYINEMMQPFGRRRYLLAFMDPFSATYHWSAFERLAMYERAMDVLTLFPTTMDLGRNFTYYRNYPTAGRKLDNYFGCEWRHIVEASPKRAEHELRALYERRMNTILDFKIGHTKGVGLGKRPLYHLIFGSKSEFGMSRWNDVNKRTPWEQEEMWLDGA
jgi:three-Cys-motif partner protein